MLPTLQDRCIFFSLVSRQPVIFIVSVFPNTANHFTLRSGSLALEMRSIISRLAMPGGLRMGGWFLGDVYLGSIYYVTAELVTCTVRGEGRRIEVLNTTTLIIIRSTVES